jgi:hypothetical protein
MQSTGIVPAVAAAAPYRITVHALPGVLRTIAEMISVEVAVEVARQLGGRKFYVATSPSSTHALVQIVGSSDAAARLFQEIGGDYITIPSARPQLRKADAARLRLEGRSVRQIATELDISQSHAESLVRGVPKPAVVAASEVADAE